MVAAGILLSRLVGLVRQAVFNRYFGLSDAADAFTSAFRIPNLLQNLFGEGALSASFIPVYAGLMARGEREEANRVAGAVAALLALGVTLLVLVGVVATPALIDLITPGFMGAKRELTITLVRILFPGAGLFVLSAWCLGILNSHRQFLLSYAAPVFWNLVMIAALLLGRHLPLPRLAIWTAWASVLGAAVQFLVQVPPVLRLTGGLRLVLDTASAHVRTIGANFVPAFVGRGAAQLSAYVDMWLASFLPTGAVAGLTAAQNVYMLPVSLFGMSISAAELPAMSEAAGDEAQVAGYLRARLDAGLRQIAFFVVPSALAFLALGQMIAQVLYQGRRFTADDSRYVWGILAGSAVGLLASTMARLYSSTWYALKDTRTPLRFALLRVGLTMVLGWFAALYLPDLVGAPRRWGAAGLTASAGVAGWVEFVLLRRALNRRIGRTGVPLAVVARLWGAAAVGALAAWAVLAWAPLGHRIVQGLAVLGTYGLVYLFCTFALGVPQARTLLARVGLGRRAAGGGGGAR
ncbi:MAG TPA: murein biosynthesis integral membrane protein MurJ [Gemmatimonadales bacterium]|nr:murein biosynthesis integral membrane protein MurJ [Gemmatimonadales bacterium]